MNLAMKCELCLREVENYTVHHLIPRSRAGSGGPRAILCKACHRMVHHIFNNKELAAELDSIEKIKQHPEIQKFVKWVRKQDPHKHIKI